MDLLERIHRWRNGTCKPCDARTLLIEAEEALITLDVLMKAVRRLREAALGGREDAAREAQKAIELEAVRLEAKLHERTD